jgi:hypothetical protein
MVHTMKASRLERFKIAKNDIVAFFDAQLRRIFHYSDISHFLREQRAFWRLTDSVTVQDFLEFLTEKSRLNEVRVNFPHRPVTRFIWGDVPLFELVLSFQSDSYLSHYTAVYLHDLTEQIPRTIYLNFEQRPKSYQMRGLQQASIDTAFKRPMRTSKNIAPFRDFRICLLNSMGIGNLGVIESHGHEGENIRLTNVEKTLIDITVRPGYAGGVFEVLEAYRNAKGKFSVNKLTALLKQLNYVYPYHQAIGFYLQRAEVYDESTIKLLRKFDMDYDFYLAHGMAETDYSREWRLFFPKGF